MGKINISKKKIIEFLALFNDDVSAAKEALTEYQQETQPSSTPSPHLKSKSGDDIISIQDVSKRYKLGKQHIDALHNITLSIHKGEFIAITGASGSGKSTLLQIIGCLDKPTTGKVIVESKETTHLSDSMLSELRRDTIGFIFQSFYLQPFLRVSDNLSVPAMFTSRKKVDIDAEVDSLLQRVGLTERAKHFPKELSGGQIQRAAIARALINNPRIILADEPTGNLDSENGQSIIALFRTIRDTLGTTIVVVTHDDSIARQADRVIELRDGVLV